MLGLLAAPEFLGAGELAAAPARDAGDPDHDGLQNRQETVLGTNPFQADTDADGFSDLEEVARKTSPLYPQSVPQGNRMQLGMSCRGGDNELHALIAIYLPNGDLRDKTFQAGFLVNGRVVTLREGYLGSHATLVMHDAATPGAKIATVDLPISPRMVQSYGDISLFATLGSAADGVVQAADSIHLIAFGQTIVLQVQTSMLMGASLQSGGTGHQTGGAGTGHVGSIYIPLSTGSDQTGWISGQVCVQQTALIGTSGAMITQEVVSAECQDGWDGFCPASCSATVGNTYTTVDPVGLIGG
ncbi:MAG: hypothetical protein IPJ19_06700 [Planctomycetes bacterium]|nr:hypothetical protein [Planctomycetota bacterium]